MKKQLIAFSAVAGLLVGSVVLAEAPTSSEILSQSQGNQPLSGEYSPQGAGNGSLPNSGGTQSMPNPPSVPEPASLLLIGIGLAGIGLARRRRS